MSSAAYSAGTVSGRGERDARRRGIAPVRREREPATQRTGARNAAGCPRGGHRGWCFWYSAATRGLLPPGGRSPLLLLHCQAATENFSIRPIRRALFAHPIWAGHGQDSHPFIGHILISRGKSQLELLCALALMKPFRICSETIHENNLQHKLARGAHLALNVGQSCWVVSQYYR